MSDLSRFFPEDEATAAKLTFSQMAQGMSGSKILQIAYAVKERIAAGEQVADFTVGDFAPQQFQVPEQLKKYVADALAANQTNYPPADGIPELRKAIVGHYARHLGLEYPADSVVVASGARPVLYAAYRCLVDPGETVVYPVPSWNNANFSHLVGAKNVPVATRPEDAFMPAADALAPHLRAARLLVLCSPLNPCGTMFRREQLAAINEVVLAENARREKAGERLLYVVYDQVYRMLTFGGLEHTSPVQVNPEMARYTLYTDAISKCFAATGLRVGWLVAPPFVARTVKALMTHVGAWAPRPEQYATAKLLADDAAIAGYLQHFKAGLRERSDLLYDAFHAWKKEGLPVDAIAPEGAFYLSVRFDLIGRPGIPDESAMVKYLLEKAGCAIVPFSAFGDKTNVGWVRFSVGAVGPDDIRTCLPRLKAALLELA
jgi:aspartate aminotransferase